MAGLEKENVADLRTDDFSFDVEPILNALRRPGKRFYVASAILLAIVAFGLYAYLYQFINGLARPG